MSTQPIAAEGTTPKYNLDDILSYTQPTKEPGGFRRVLGAVAGGVGNVLLPGVGSLIGSWISGSGGAAPGLGGETTQFLELQRRMHKETIAFETASNLMKVRFEASRTAIRHMGGN